MKKGLKVFLTAAIVLSAVACSTSNDEVKEGAKEKVVETKEEPSVPKEYRNALRSAETYSDMMHMSKQGIFDQLTSEYGDQFDAEAAQYAIDNLDANYNENALKCGENYKKTMEYKYNTDNETVNKLALYYSGKKIYRISLKYNEHMFNFDIGDTKYYFKYYKDGEEKLSFDFTSVSRQVQNITNKTIEVNYNYGEKSGVITLKLMANEKPKLKKADVETYKSVDELTDEEINQIGDNMSYYKEDIKDTIVKLFSFFDKRCNENLECVCDNGNKTCSCAYNGGMITCKYEDVKKSD